jgi:hypothetical protein
MNIYPLSVTHSVNLFVQTFSVLCNSEQSTEVTPLAARLYYTYDECCVRKETSLPPLCVTVDQAERTSAPSPTINEGQILLKHADHKSLYAAPTCEGYKKREYRRQSVGLSISTNPDQWSSVLALDTFFIRDTLILLSQLYFIWDVL